MDALLVLPNWALYALVGAVLGGIGGSVGWLLERATGWRFWRVVPIIAAAGSVQLTSNIVIPKIAEVALNRDLPKKMDEVTTLTHISIPSLRHYIYSFDLADTVPTDLTATGVKELIQVDACLSLKTLFQTSEVRTITYVYRSHGQLISVDFIPEDC